MNRDIIFAIVIMVFVYLIGKYKLLPYFAAKKILKDAKNGKAATDAASQPQPPDIVTQMLLAQSFGHSMTNTQPQPDISRHGVMYFDYTFIDLDADTDEEINVFADVDIELLEPLRKRGIFPDVFNLLYVGSGTILAYVTYVA